MIDPALREFARRDLANNPPEPASAETIAFLRSALGTFDVQYAKPAVLLAA